MKKLICFITLLLVIFITPHVQAASIKGALCLTGGGNCLDAIDGNNISAGDGAVVTWNDTETGKLQGYMYVVVESSATEASPAVITPDTNPGTKRWHLVKMVTADTYAELVAKWVGCTGYLKHDGTCDSGDNLGTALYSNIVALWASGTCTGYMKSNGLCDSGDNLGNASYSNVVSLWEVGCAGYLKHDGTCDVGGGGSGGNYEPEDPPTAGTSGIPQTTDTGATTWIGSATSCVLMGTVSGNSFECATPINARAALDLAPMYGTPTDGHFVVWYYDETTDPANPIWTISTGDLPVTDNTTNGKIVKKVVTGGAHSLEDALAGTDYATPNSDTTGTASKMPVNAATDAAGEHSTDSTTGQSRTYDGTRQNVFSPIQFISFVIAAPADTDDINVMKAPYGMTILGIDCIVQGTTSVTGQIQECTSAGASCGDLDSDITCDADGAADDGTLTDSTIASGAWLRWKTTSLSGTPTFLTVTVRYRVVAD
jgi:hypothetical protein